MQNAGFIPQGSVNIEEAAPGTCEMTLTLRYTLPDPVAKWKVAIIVSPLVQGIVRNRMVAGMERFGRTMRREYADSAHRNAER